MYLCCVVLLTSVICSSWALDPYEAQFGTVKYVSTLFRHGARTPDSLAPNDPYNDEGKYWPEGLGHLTKEGILQHYQLGAWLSKRYKHLLPRQKTKVNECIKVVSTDWPRTLQSAGAEMAGLFPIDYSAYDASLWFGLPSYPVPIRSVAGPVDRLMEVTATCKRYSALLKQFGQSKEYNDMLDKYQSMTTHLINHSGQRFFNLDFYMELFTTYGIEEGRGLELPDWVREVYPKPMIEPTIESFVTPTWTTAMKRLRGGPFVKEIIDNFWNKASGKLNPPTQNVTMYSAHDTTISAVLNTMGIFNRLPPPFATMVLFELRERNGENVVTIWYKNSTNEEPHLLTVPKCSPACPLAQLEKLMKSVIPTNWEEECEDVPVGITDRLSGPKIDEIHYDMQGRRKNPDYFKAVRDSNTAPRSSSPPVGTSTSSRRSENRDRVVF